MASEHIEYRRNQELEVTVLPHETILRGVPARVGHARALCAEVYGPRPILQTFGAEARDLETHAKRVWSIYCEQPRAHRRSQALGRRVMELSARLSRLNLPWDEWQVLYRLLLQVDRALDGDEPLLEHARRLEDTDMEEKALPPARTRESLPATRGLQTAAPASVQAMTSRELIGHTLESAAELVKKEIELAKAELRADLKKEMAMVKGLGVAGLCAIWAVGLMLTAGTLALGLVLPAWAGALIVAAAVLAVGTLAGLVLGVVFCLNIEVLRQIMAWATNTTIFDPNVYYLTRLPADMDVSETVSIVAMAMALSVLATLYPSWRASTLDPVEALRYE